MRCSTRGAGVHRLAVAAAATAGIVRSFGTHLREWSSETELDAIRPGLAEATEEYAAQVDGLADDLERGSAGSLGEVMLAHSQLGAELRAAVSAAARADE